ncbi:MAG: alginate O-acetyltransferase complex protein AlgI [Motiliproteus sp.]
MLFNSYEFIFVFLPLVYAVFLLIGTGSHYRLTVSWLVGASLFFYGWWNPKYLLLILVSILFNFIVGRYLQSGTRQARTFLTLGVLINLGALAYFKYAGFMVTNLNALTDSGFSVPSVILPLAISFFTFQQVAYLVDTYRGLTRECDFLHYCLFVTFFPQLIAGPIVHHKEMLPQFADPGTFRPRLANLSIGLSIFIVGLFKKVVIADNLALEATPLFTAADAGQGLDFFQAWTAMLGYSFQLYFDFSGYCDMAIGVSRMFGITLPQNFNSPYKATSIVDFWRRWHITLSRFLRDYLYFALGGNKKGPARRQVNLMVTMVLGGLWHGAGWTFVLWGALHGLFLVINHLWHGLWQRPLDRWWSLLLGRGLTFLAVSLAWVFFRAETLDGALLILSALTNFPDKVGVLLGSGVALFEPLGVGFTGGYLTPNHLIGSAWFGLLLALVWVLPNTQQWFIRSKPIYRTTRHISLSGLQRRLRLFIWQPQWATVAMLGVMAAGSILSLSQVSEFLYFQF